MLSFHLSQQNKQRLHKNYKKLFSHHLQEGVRMPREFVSVPDPLLEVVTTDE
jgi:hypothetical protein